MIRFYLLAMVRHIIINFISAEEEDDGNLIHQPRIIFVRYIKGWFLFDFMAAFQSVLPFILSKDLLMGDEYIDFKELSQIDKT